MATVIPTDNVLLVDVPQATIWVAPRLGTGEWQPAPYLFLRTLTRTAAPQIDQAFLYRDYGPLIRENTFEFAEYTQDDLIGWFVKIIIADAEGAEVDRWYGIIEVENNEVIGLSLRDPVSRGRQNFVAFGLLRLLERVFFRSSTKFSDDTETDRITIARGIPFNMSEFGEYAETGNRSAATSDGGVYLFSDAPELADEWTAFTAAQYLLANHVPIDGNDNPIATWQLADNAESILGWYVIHVRTEGRSVKDILDELIPRKRCVGYAVDYDEDTNTVGVELFTLNGTDLILPTGTIPANPDQRILDFETAVSISSARLQNVATTTYHEIIARGDPRTSTATLRFNPQFAEWDKAWTTELETEYLEGGSLKGGYGSLENIEKYQLNAAVRSNERFFTVFRRFKLASDFSQKVAVLFQNDDDREFFLAPRILVDGSFDAEWAEGKTGEPLWLQNLVIQRKLALRQGLDYSDDRIETGDYLEEPSGSNALDTSQYVRPLFFMRLPDGSDYVYLENLSVGSGFETHNRNWSVQPEILGKGPVLDLHVVGGPQQFIAADFWDSAEATDPIHVPENYGGLDYDSFYCTLTYALDSRVEYAITLISAGTGIQKRVLYIDVPDARLDYVVPYTVVGINEEGVVQTTSGGVIRDDRERLELIAKSAAEWYGKVRQTLDLTFRKISPVVSIGSLIVEIPSIYQREDVNTVVTRLTYDFSDPRNATTSFETTFAEFDLL